MIEEGYTGKTNDQRTLASRAVSILEDSQPIFCELQVLDS